MKKEMLKTFVISVITLVLALPASGQMGIEDGSKYGHGQDSINCLMNLSLYREFFKHDNYNDAIGPWRLVFEQCPASSEYIYLDGVKMFRDYADEAKAKGNNARMEEYIDTLMLVYDRRVEYFGGEGNILGRKAIDLLRYRRDDIKSIELAHDWLKKSLQLEQKDSRDAIFVVFVSSSVSLAKTGAIAEDIAIEDYFFATELVDAILAKKKSRKYEEAKAAMDETMMQSGYLTCEKLNDYFEPKFDGNSNDEEFLRTVIKFYDATSCTKANVYAKASELLYTISPTPDAALPLARLFAIKEDYIKASRYYKEALGGEDLDLATVYYELAFVTEQLNDICEAIGYAKKAISINPDFGKAYLLLGDLYIAGKGSLGDNFEQSTAFWAAADKYNKAKTVDPSLASSATKKISDYMALYPNNEELFFRDMKEGDSYLVKGCINEYTTVKAKP